MAKAKPKAIGYVRVSRLAGRKGDSFLSPDLQRQSIERVCAKEGLTLIDVVEELDVSAKQGAKRPLWERTLERMEKGEAQALVTWNVERVARSIVDGFQAIERVEAAGGRLISEDGATSKLDRGIRLLLGEVYIDQVRDATARARADAIARGVYIARRMPFGYIRGEDRRLAPDPEKSPIVVELFERRAKGQSWVSLVKWFSTNGGSPRASRGSLRDMIRNVAYLGHARSGEFVNTEAHPPIVSRRLFDKANQTAPAPKHDGSISSKTLLAPTCATCGHRMQANNSQGKRLPDGKREKVIAYSCLNLHCDARASVRASELEPWVVGNLFLLLAKVGTTGYELPTYNDPQDLSKAKQALEEAQYARDWHIENLDLRKLMGQHAYNAQLIRLSEEVEERRIALDMFDQPEPPQVEDIRSLWAVWDVPSRREWLRSMVDSVIVEPARRKRGISLIKRVEIVYSVGWAIGQGKGVRLDDDELRASFIALDMYYPGS